MLGFTEREGEAALRRWLNGQQVRAGEMRGVIEQAEAEVAETARESGVKLPATVELSRTIHGRLSQPTTMTDRGSRTRCFPISA